MVREFVHLHVHSDMSQLDGLARVEEYVAEAARRGNPAIGITDHGTMRGYLAQQEQCRRREIKPVFGCEFYVSPDMLRRGMTTEEREAVIHGLPKREHKAAIRRFESELGLRDRWHLSVWAANDAGVQNLYRLTSAAWVEGFYYKPRIDIDHLIKHGEGLMVASGCLSSPIHEMFRTGKKREAIRVADRLAQAFGDRFYLEVQPHAIREQREANRLARGLRNRYGAKLLATQDAHYLHKADAPHHDCLLCIGTGSRLSDADRFRFDGDEFFFKTRKQIERAFQRNHEFMRSQEIREALDTTVEFAERCSASVEIDYKKALLPTVSLPREFRGKPRAYLRRLCLDGWAWRNIHERARAYGRTRGMGHRKAVAVYRERLFHELRELARQRFERYFLIVHDVYRHAREQGVMVGPGRGSAGGSLVAYLLGITAVDPVAHGLLFERFINPDRKDLPDIDMDFEDRRRGEMIEYMRQKYGADRVSQITTVSRLGAKQCVRDVSRVADVPLFEVNRVTPSLIERGHHDEGAWECVRDSFRDVDEVRAFGESFPVVAEHAEALEGRAKSLGVHPAGVVASPVPLRELLPLESRKSAADGRLVVTALDMNEVAQLGLVKFDFLGLKMLTVIKEALEAIEERHGRKIDLEAFEFDLNDPKVLERFTALDFAGVFQFDTESAARVCKGIEFESFADVATLTALNRPGASKSGMDDAFRERKNNPRLRARDEFHPLVSEITADSLGVPCFQEHAIRIFRDVAGFSPGEADTLRKMIGKKLGEGAIDEYRTRFVEGAARRGLDSATAHRVMDFIVRSASYLFAKAHAVEYGTISYWCQWLKVYYPPEFFCALMRSETDSQRVRHLVTEARRRGIEVLPAHVNHSGRRFTIQPGRNAIRGALSDIKGVGPKACESITALQPFENFTDFVTRVERRAVHRGVVGAIAKASALDGLVNTKWLLENLGDIWRQLARRSFDPAALQSDVARALDGEADYAAEDRALLGHAVTQVGVGGHPLTAYAGFCDQAVRVPLTPLEGADFYERHDGAGLFVLGVIQSIKFHKFGDFDERTKRGPLAKFRGRPTATVMLEDATGTARRVKFDHYTFAESRSALDEGKGAPILVLLQPSAFSDSIRASFAIGMVGFRERFLSGGELTFWERVVSGNHPAVVRRWKNARVAAERAANREFTKGTGNNFTGVVTHVRPHADRHGNSMAYFGLLDGAHRYVEVIAFNSAWNTVAQHVTLQRLIRLPLTRNAKSVNDARFYFRSGNLRLFGG